MLFTIEQLDLTLSLLLSEKEPTSLERNKQPLFDYTTFVCCFSELTTATTTNEYYYNSTLVPTQQW